MRIIVPDTNIILHEAQSIFKFGDNEIVIPAIVLEEIDSKKRNQDEVGRNARVFSRIIDDLRKEYPGQLNMGVPLETGGTLRVELNHVSFERMEKSFNDKTNDNRIIAVALNLKADEDEKENIEDRKEVVLVTNDMLAGVKADTLGITVEKYESDRLIDNLEEVHKGYKEIYVPSDLIDEFYEEETLPFESLKEYLDNEVVYPQDFLIMKSLENQSKSGIGRFLEIKNELKLVTFVLEDEDEIWNLTSRNVKQKMFLELLMDPKVELVCGVGPAGTGKTLLALAASLQQTENDKLYKKTLVARPVIPMGKDIGYLPGDMNEKLRPWMQPIFDNLEFLFDIDEDKKNSENVEDKIKDLKLEIEALTYIRGRSIPKQFIILDEIQNMSPHEIKTVITRAGEGTKIILLGDPQQIDHPYLDSTNNALTYVIEKMKHLPQVGVIKLDKTERSTLADLAAKLL